MKDIDLDYFQSDRAYRNEEIVSSIDCIHEGNPFVGTLILTDHRLAFVRKSDPGFEFLSIKSSLILGLSYHIDYGLDFILVIELEKMAHKFELRAIDTASKQRFMYQIQEQFGPFDTAPDDQPISSSRMQ